MKNQKSKVAVAITLATVASVVGVANVARLAAMKQSSGRILFSDPSTPDSSSPPAADPAVAPAVDPAVAAAAPAPAGAPTPSKESGAKPSNPPAKTAEKGGWFSITAADLKRELGAMEAQNERIRTLAQGHQGVFQRAVFDDMVAKLGRDAWTYRSSGAELDAKAKDSAYFDVNKVKERFLQAIEKVKEEGNADVKGQTKNRVNERFGDASSSLKRATEGYNTFMATPLDAHLTVADEVGFVMDKLRLGAATDFSLRRLAFNTKLLNEMGDSHTLSPRQVRNLRMDTLRLINKIRYNEHNGLTTAESTLFTQWASHMEQRLLAHDVMAMTVEMTRKQYFGKLRRAGSWATEKLIGDPVHYTGRKMRELFHGTGNALFHPIYSAGRVLGNPWSYIAAVGLGYPLYQVFQDYENARKNSRYTEEQLKQMRDALGIEAPVPAPAPQTEPETKAAR